jgi:hypothetical protein
MRYHFIPLSLVFLLGACASDPTAPPNEPQVDIGRDSPEPEPDQDAVLCLAKQASVSSSATKSASEAIRIPPVCPVL